MCGNTRYALHFASEFLSGGTRDANRSDAMEAVFSLELCQQFAGELTVSFDQCALGGPTRKPTTLAGNVQRWFCLLCLSRRDPVNIL